MNNQSFETKMGILCIVFLFVGLHLTEPRPVTQPQPQPVEVVEESSPDLSTQIDEIIHMYDNEISCLATNMYFEARGEDPLGQEAVALVTLNRVMSDRYPNTVCGVVYQAKTTVSGFPLRNQCQFSWYCDGKPDVISHHVYQEIYERAQLIYKNYYLIGDYIDDVTEGSTHYHAVYVQPYWSRHENYQQVASIGDHVFYRPTY